MARITTWFAILVLAVGCYGFPDTADDHAFLPRSPVLLNPDEVKQVTLGNYDDEKLSPEQERAKKFRLAIRGDQFRWRDNIVWYTVAKYAFNDVELKELHESFRDFEAETCLQFRPATKDTPNFIVIRQGSGGCNSLVGQAYTNPMGQAVNLGNGCKFYGLYRHELGHAVGFHHEHQNPERINDVDIIKENVEASWRIWFDPVPAHEFDSLGIKYDMQSIMHYEDTAFSKTGPNGEQYTTIQPRDPRKLKYLGRVYLKDFSFLDIKKLNIMYKCNTHCPSNQCNGENQFFDKNCKCVTEDEFAARRCYDAQPAEWCEANKNSCGWYTAHVGCRKTCNHCFEPYHRL